MNDLLQQEQKLHAAAEDMLGESPLLPILKSLGEPIITGSYQTGLMTYPDIDFAVQSQTTSYQDLVNIVPKINDGLSAQSIKIVNFDDDLKESATGYLGIRFEFKGIVWNIDATITKPGPITTNPVQLAGWLKSMTDEQRAIILKLKKELIDAKRYVGSRSQPPHTFRSIHLYEGVLVGRATTIQQLEDYFKNLRRLKY